MLDENTRGAPLERAWGCRRIGPVQGADALKDQTGDEYLRLRNASANWSRARRPTHSRTKPATNTCDCASRTRLVSESAVAALVFVVVPLRIRLVFPLRLSCYCLGQPRREASAHRNGSGHPRGTQFQQRRSVVGITGGELTTGRWG
jgi:hypothetical protein